MSNILITKAFCSTAVGSSKFVLLTLCDAANQDSECWLGLDTLCVKTGLSKTAIKSAVSKLEVDGHISVKRRYNKTNIYALHPVESKVAKELLYDKPSLEHRESLLDQVFTEISNKKKALASGEISMSRNPAHQKEGSMSRNPTSNEPESDLSMSRNPANNPKGTQKNPKEEADASPLPFVPAEADKAKATSKAKANKKPGSSMTLAEYLQHCEETGAYPLPETHYVWTRSEKMGLPDELVLLDWQVFKEKYLNDQKAKTKKYADWLQHFCNSLEKNWNGLYFKKADGSVVLTTAGKNQQALHGIN